MTLAMQAPRAEAGLPGHAGRMLLAALTAAAMGLASPGAAQVAEYAIGFGSETAPRQLLMRTATDIDVLAPLLAAYTDINPDVGITIESWNTNDLYTVSDRACRDRQGAADLLISSAVDQMVKLANDGCARPHASSLTQALAATTNWRDEVFGVTSEPAVIVYNRDLVPPADAPQSRFDLLDLLRRQPQTYFGKVATYDIRDSGVGYMLAVLDSQQATTFGSLIEAFGRTGAVATCCSAEIIEGVAAGTYLIAYNVLGSYALARAADDPRLAVVLPEDYTLVLSRAALIPKGAANPADAGALVDFMLSPAGRALLAGTHMIVDVAPEEQARLRPIPLSPVLLVNLDRQKRALMLARWDETFPPR